MEQRWAQRGDESTRNAKEKSIKPDAAVTMFLFRTAVCEAFPDGACARKLAKMQRAIGVSLRAGGCKTHFIRTSATSAWIKLGSGSQSSGLNSSPAIRRG